MKRGKNMKKYVGSHHYISAWGYIGYSILYFIPVIGWIILFVHAGKNKNENRKNYAGAKLIAFVIFLLICAAVVGAYYLTPKDTVNDLIRDFNKWLNDAYFDVLSFTAKLIRT